MDLTIIIPARNEEFLGRTVQDLLEHIESDTEIIVVLDGYLPDPPLPISDRVTVIYNPVAVGQRAASNQAAKIANGKYVMKVDAHCAFDQGFDRKMLEAFRELGDDVTMIPVMRNLHAFDWVCENGHRRYQSPSGVCEECGKETKKDVVWIPKKSPATFTFRFDKTMHFQYHGEQAKHPNSIRGVLRGYVLSFDSGFVSSSVIDFFADLASSHKLTVFSDPSWWRENMPVDTMSFPSVHNSEGVGPSKIERIAYQPKMNRVTATSVVTEMVNNGYVFSSSFGNFSKQPSIHKSVDKCFFPVIGDPPVTTYIFPPDPVPTTTGLINGNFLEKLNNVFGGRFSYNEKTKCFHNGIITLEPVFDTNYRETLSIQGSCFMLTKEKYFELDICSEDFHSWGQQGVEVACKTWLSGGRVIANLNTWYAHMFRTRGGDFGFPYHNPQNLVNENRELSRELFMKDKWPLATKKFQWLLDKFNPPDWEESRGIIYYTTSDLDERVARPVRDRLLEISKDKKLDITSSSLKKMNFGVKNIHFPSLNKGYLAMFKQIVAALENSKDDIIFFTEHDVLYHPSHFDFMPEKKDTFYYNQNVWLLRLPDGHALHYDVNQLSGLCVYRETALKHFRERYEMAEKAHEELGEAEFNRFVRNMGFEPMTHGRVAWKNKFPFETWKSEYPNVDIKHGANATGQRWNKEQYRNQNLLVNWQESEDWNIPGWEKEELKVLVG